MLANAKVDPGKVFDAVWKNDDEFATCGAKHVKLFASKGRNLTPKKGVYTKVCGMVAMTCC